MYETTPDTKTINNQHYKCQTNAPSPTASSLQMQIWIMPIVGMQHMQKCRCACNVDSSQEPITGDTWATQDTGWFGPVTPEQFPGLVARQRSPVPTATRNQLLSRSHSRSEPTPIIPQPTHTELWKHAISYITLTRQLLDWWSKEAYKASVTEYSNPLSVE